MTLSPSFDLNPDFLLGCRTKLKHIPTMESSGARRVLLVIDSSTRRVVSTRPLRPAGLDADAMLAEYMAYQQLLVRMQRRH